MRNVVLVGSVVALFAAITAVSLVSSGNVPLAFLVPLAFPLALVATAVIALAAVKSPSATIVLLVVLVFLTDANFRIRDPGDTSIDWQSLLKFAAWLVCGLVGMLRLPPIGKLLGHAGASLWLLYLTLAVLSGFYAPAPVLSFGYAISLFCFYVFCLALIETLTEVQILWTIVLTLLVFLIVGWIVYYADPELGRFSDFTTSGSELRMNGIAGEANNLGSVCSVYLGALFILWWKRRCGLFPFIALSVIGCATLVNADSRTAWLSTIAGVLAVVITRSFWRLAGSALAGTLLVGAVLTARTLLNSLGSQISRSGDPSEVTTLTGRTQIWEFTWQKILESPIVGWGYNSSKVVIGEHIGFANGLIVDTAHNMLLQNLLSVGVLGTLPIAGLFLKLILDVVRLRPDPLSVLFLVVAFVTGITDSSPVGTTPTLLSLMFILASLWPARDDARLAPSPPTGHLLVANRYRQQEGLVVQAEGT